MIKIIDYSTNKPTSYEWHNLIFKYADNGITIKNMSPEEFTQLFSENIIDYEICGGKDLDWGGTMQIGAERYCFNGSAWYGYVDSDCWENVEEEEEE